MRAFGIAAVLFLSACGSAPSPSSPDTTLPAWYASSIDQLATLNSQAEAFFKGGDSDRAAARIKDAQTVAARLLSVPRPSLPAAEAAADLDDLYGRMLLSNRHYAEAQMFFQKNRSRWKNWLPQTPETTRRLQQAVSEIQECDRHIPD